MQKKEIRARFTPFEERFKVKKVFSILQGYLYPTTITTYDPLTPLDKVLVELRRTTTTGSTLLVYIGDMKDAIAIMDAFVSRDGKSLFDTSAKYLRGLIIDNLGQTHISLAKWTRFTD